MFSHTQLEEVARMKHADLLAKAAIAHKYALVRREKTSYLPALLQWLGDQGRKWRAPRRPLTVDPVAVASRQQAC